MARARPRATPKEKPPAATPAAGDVVEIPREGEKVVLEIEGKKVQVTNLAKPFWPELGITKGDLIRYYVSVAWALLPHIEDRPMVMRRYPDGARGMSFFMKRAPSGKPEWVPTCRVLHGSGNVIDFPVISDVPSLVWVVNLGCIDLNPWYSRQDDVDRPDFLHFDLDPGEAPWERVCETALILHEAFKRRGVPDFVKTSGSKGIHVYIPIVRGPLQKEVWTVAKKLANDIARENPLVATAEYRKAKRPPGRVLIDYNQNRWGSTLASIYSVRPHPRAAVSTPVTWDELASGIRLEDFRIDNVPGRLREKGDLWAPVAPRSKGRCELSSIA